MSLDRRLQRVSRQTIVAQNRHRSAANDWENVSAVTTVTQPQFVRFEFQL